MRWTAGRTPSPAPVDEGCRLPAGRAGPRDSGEVSSRGYRSRMKLLRTIAAAGVTKKLIDEARKPENQAKIKSGVEALRNRTRGRRR